MATILGEKQYFGNTMDDILAHAHGDARELAPGNTGKISTRVESWGSGEDEKGILRFWARVSFHLSN